MKQENSFQLIKKPMGNLRKGQQDLYVLITDKLSNNSPITFEEAHKVWIEKVCRNVSNGIPMYNDMWHHKNEKGEWQWGWSPLTEYNIRQSVIQWLASTIGVLVMKGYLKVIPQIELETLT